MSELWHTLSHDGAFVEVGSASLVVLQHLLLLVVSPLLLHLLPCLMVTLIRLGGREGGGERETERERERERERRRETEREKEREGEREKEGEREGERERERL